MEEFRLVPLSLSEVFDRCFELLRQSFGRLFLTGSILLVPVSVATWLLMRGFFSSISGLAGEAIQGAAPDAELLYELFKAMGGMGVGVLLLGVAETLALVSFVLVLCGEVVGRRYEVTEVLRLTLSIRGIKAVIQKWLGELASASVFLVPYLLFIFVASADMGTGPILLSIIFLISGIAAFVYLRVRWAFGIVAIAWEDEDILGAFSRSSLLVYRHGLRTFGLLVLFSLLTAFVVSMIMAPVQFFVFWDIVKAYIDMFTSMSTDFSEPDPSGILKALARIGPGLAVLIALKILLTAICQSLYLSTFYYDLRARHGEFEPDPSTG